MIIYQGTMVIQRSQVRSATAVVVVMAGEEETNIVANHGCDGVVVVGGE